MKKLFLLLLAVVAGAATAWADDFKELLTNGACDGTFSGWTKTDGGNGWGIGQDPDGSYFWASSFEPCTLSQTILLSEKGLGDADIDAGNVSCKASAMIKAIWDPKNTGRGSDIAKVYVEMQDGSGNVLSTITVLDDRSIFLEWTLFQTNEFTLVSGTRKLRVVIEGQDSAYWSGQFGPCFKNVSLMANNYSGCGPNGHEWGEWSVTAYPTCTDSGSQTRTCNNCGMVANETIPAMGHDWGEWELSSEPSCTEDGYNVRTCQRCGLTDEEVIPALGHDWNSNGICNRCRANRLTTEGYSPLTYIVSTGEQVFNTGYIHKANTLVEMDCVVKQNQDRNYEALLGARLGNYKNNAFCFFSRFAGKNVPCFNRSGKEATGEGFVYDERILLWCTYDNATWFRQNNPLVEVGSIYNAGTVDAGKTPMFLFNLNTANTEGGVQADGSPCRMKLYSCKIHEDQVLIHNYVPAKDKNHVVGLYDLATGSFAGSITETPFYEEEGITYPITVEQMYSTIQVDYPSEAKPGAKVSVNYDYTGKSMPRVKVLDDNGNEISSNIVSLGNNKEYVAFTMPACPVTVRIMNEPDVIKEIPDGCEVRTYLRHSAAIYSSYGLYSEEVSGKFKVAFAPDGTVYMQDPAWVIDNQHSYVKGTYNKATGIISIPTGQFLAWYSSNYYGVQLGWGSTLVVTEQDPETGTEKHHISVAYDQDVKTIEFRVDGDYLYLLNSEGNVHAEYPKNLNATGMLIVHSDDNSALSLEYANTDADGNQLPFAIYLNIVPAIPADPVLTEWHDGGNESGYSRLNFTMPLYDINGKPMDQDLLSYSIFTDNGNGPELFTFLAEVYAYDLTEDLTEIPYTLTGYDFKSSLLYFYRTNAEGHEPFFTQRLGMQVYYTVNGVRNQSNIVWIDNPVGIGEVKAEQGNGGDKIYNLAGQRLEKLQKGINIVNGKKVLVK